MIETASYSEFSRVVHEEVNALRVPVNGTIEVTNRCPLECAHCYNNLPMGDAVARRRELTLEEHKRVLDELSDLGCLWLLLTGGEISRGPISWRSIATRRRRASSSRSSPTPR